MPNDELTPKPMNMDCKVFDGERLLAAGLCTLWPDHRPAEGAMAVPSGPNWFSFSHLTLVAADGTEYSIVPKRIEHGGASTTMAFNIE